MQVTTDGTTLQDDVPTRSAGQEVSATCKVKTCDPLHAEGSGVQEDTMTVKAHLTWEGIQFLRDHACHIEHCPAGDVITFPAGSRKARLSPRSRYCSTITLPDATEITSIDCPATAILLLIDTTSRHMVHLTF